MEQTEKTGPREADQGRAAARRLWLEGLSAVQIDDPLHVEFANAALHELEELQKGTPGVLQQVLDGAQQSAEQLNVKAFHGILEVVQNADDLGATEVRVALEKRGRRQILLLAHNGDRVRLNHVIAMTLAFVSTKRDDPTSKGRFGIGLKTLGRGAHRTLETALQYRQTPQLSGLPATGPGDHLARPCRPGLRYAPAGTTGPKPAPDSLIGVGPPIGGRPLVAIVLFAGLIFVFATRGEVRGLRTTDSDIH